MNNNTIITKIMQATEEAQAAIHVPIVFGNECYIVTLQDVRKIKDIRHLSYSKLTPKGELIPMNALNHDMQTRNSILNGCQYRMQIEQNAHNGSNGNNITDVNAGTNEIVQPMEVSLDNRNAATLMQQLQWEKTCSNSSAPFPMHYTTATSTGDLLMQKEQSSTVKCCCCCSSCCAQTNNTQKCYCTRGANTADFAETTQENDAKSALAQLKLKKICQDF